METGYLTDKQLTLLTKMHWNEKLHQECNNSNKAAFKNHVMIK